MNIDWDTVYAAACILSLLSGPAYIIWDSKRSDKNCIKEREIRKKYMSADKDLDSQEL
jgi:hypothetical protein